MPEAQLCRYTYPGRHNVCIFPAWHSNECTFFTFNDLDVMHCEFIIDRDRYDSLHFSFFVYFSNSHICNIHTSLPLCFCISPQQGGAYSQAVTSMSVSSRLPYTAFYMR